LGKKTGLDLGQGRKETNRRRNKDQRGRERGLENTNQERVETLGSYKGFVKKGKVVSSLSKKEVKKRDVGMSVRREENVEKIRVLKRKGHGRK